MSKLTPKTQGSSNTGKGGWEVELGPCTVGGYPGEGKGLLKKTVLLGLSHVTLPGAGWSLSTVITMLLKDDGDRGIGGAWVGVHTG